MSESLRFGILGTGNIAAQFADALQTASRSEIVAVASRRGSTASQFARRFDILNAHAGYDALIADARVEAVYNALPNNLHHEWTIRALRAGKHVLCEKPLAVTAAEAEEMFDVSRHTGRLLVEGFMYRNHPLTAAWLEELRSGVIGDLTLVRTSFCYATRRIADNIRFDPQLAGGALMDVGCYCINLSRLVAGTEPRRMQVSARRHETGVDCQAAGTLEFPSGLLASFACGMNAQTDNSAFLCGAEGFIQVPVPWKPAMEGAGYIVRCMAAPKMDKSKGNETPDEQAHRVDADRPLFALEADDFTAAVQDGATPVISEQDSLGNMRVLEELRRQVIEQGP